MPGEQKESVFLFSAVIFTGKLSSIIKELFHRKDLFSDVIPCELILQQ